MISINNNLYDIQELGIKKIFDEDIKNTNKDIFISRKDLNYFELGIVIKTIEDINILLKEYNNGNSIYILSDKIKNKYTFLSNKLLQDDNPFIVNSLIINNIIFNVNNLIIVNKNNHTIHNLSINDIKNIILHINNGKLNKNNCDCGLCNCKLLDISERHNYFMISIYDIITLTFSNIDLNKSLFLYYSNIF